jgi:hypothetical protein
VPCPLPSSQTIPSYLFFVLHEPTLVGQREDIGRQAKTRKSQTKMSVAGQKQKKNKKSKLFAFVLKLHKRPPDKTERKGRKKKLPFSELSGHRFCLALHCFAPCQTLLYLEPSRFQSGS